MIKLLKDAIEKVSTLPEADQKEIGRELLAHVEKVRALRVDLETGISSLDAGRGRPVDMEDVIKRARVQHGKA
jgi:hypothetical protein